jgi:DNA-binding transcriptional LysR family regulator
MGIELDDIALFVEVAKRKNFSSAAQAIGVPAATLSRRISELERSIGMTLLTRTTRRIELTPIGILYYERCRHIVDEARIAHNQLHDLAVQPKGRLRLSMPPSMAQLFLPLIIREFMDQYPEIGCDVEVGNRPVDPISNPYDLILRFGQQPDSSLIGRQVVLMTQQLYASSDYLSRHGEPRTPADLSHHECLRYSMEEEHSYWLLHARDRTERVKVFGRVSANDKSVAARLAGRGMGIVPLPVFGTLERAIARLGLARVLPEWSLTPTPLFALLPARTLPAKTSAFLDFLQRRLAQPH